MGTASDESIEDLARGDAQPMRSCAASLRIDEPAEANLLMATLGLGGLERADGDPGFDLRLDILSIGEVLAGSFQFSHDVTAVCGAPRGWIYLMSPAAEARLSWGDVVHPLGEAGVVVGPLSEARLHCPAGATFMGACLPSLAPAAMGVTPLTGKAAEATGRLIAAALRDAERMRAPVGPQLERQLQTGLMTMLVDALAAAAAAPPVRPAAVVGLSVVERYIAEHLAEPLSTDKLASVAGLGARTLNRTFREVHGVSLRQYIADVRMAAAFEVLAKAPECSLTSLARRVGYRDYCSFWRHFRSRYGVGPAQAAMAGLRPPPAERRSQGATAAI